MATLNDRRAELEAAFPPLSDPLITLCILQSHLMRIQVLLHERIEAIEQIATDFVDSKHPQRANRLMKLAQDQELTRMNLIALNMSIQAPVK